MGANENFAPVASNHAAILSAMRQPVLGAYTAAILTSDSGLPRLPYPPGISWRSLGYLGSRRCSTRRRSQLPSASGRHFPAILCRYAEFFQKNKVLVLLSLMVLVFSFFPIINFFHNSTRGQIVLPYRHGGAASQNTLAVAHQTVDWGAVEDLMYSFYFSNLRLYKFAVVYVPFFSIIIFVLGLFGTISRRAVFMFLLGIVLFCCIVPHGLPFYDFFYRHLFFLKYFRNLHFFIWFFLIPLFVLLALEHWKMFTEIKIGTPKQKWFLLLYVVSVHFMAFLFVWYRKDAVPSTYVTVFLSLVLWSLIVLKQLKTNAWGFALLTLVVLVQPLESYY